MCVRFARRAEHRKQLTSRESGHDTEMRGVLVLRAAREPESRAAGLLLSLFLVGHPRREVLGWTVLLLTQPLVWLLVVIAWVLQLPVTLLANLISPRKTRSIDGRHVLITGGSEGIGLELAKMCVARGANVTLVARTQQTRDRTRCRAR